LALKHCSHIRKNTIFATPYPLNSCLKRKDRPKKVRATVLKPVAVAETRRIILRWEVGWAGRANTHCRHAKPHRSSVAIIVSALASCHGPSLSLQLQLPLSPHILTSHHVKDIRCFQMSSLPNTDMRRRVRSTCSVSTTCAGIGTTSGEEGSSQARAHGGLSRVGKCIQL